MSYVCPINVATDKPQKKLVICETKSSNLTVLTQRFSCFPIFSLYFTVLFSGKGNHWSTLKGLLHFGVNYTFKVIHFIFFFWTNLKMAHTVQSSNNRVSFSLSSSENLQWQQCTVHNEGCKIYWAFTSSTEPCLP